MRIAAGLMVLWIGLGGVESAGIHSAWALDPEPPLPQENQPLPDPKTEDPAQKKQDKNDKEDSQAPTVALELLEQLELLELMEMLQEMTFYEELADLLEEDPAQDP